LLFWQGSGRCDCGGRPGRLALAGALALAVLAAPTAAHAALPDGRAYELVSPADKSGNVVRVITEAEGPFGLASEDGEAVAYGGTGAIGTSYSGMLNVFVATRAPAGWSTRAALPREVGTISVEAGTPRTFIPSSDFGRAVFAATGSFVAGQPPRSAGIFLTEDAAVEPVWIARPLAEPPAFAPVPAPGANDVFRDYLAVGGTPDLTNVYFTYSGTLIPADAVRAPNIGNGKGQGAWGFYEWSAGALREAGTLPDGSLSPFGAVPAAIAGGEAGDRTQAGAFDVAQALDNEISADGSRAFFVSPDPLASSVTDPGPCEAELPCTAQPPQLYMRMPGTGGAKRSELVSQSQLPGQGGQPAADGVVKLETPQVAQGGRVGATYAYAAPDGSHVFFASADRLTAAAPAGGAPKLYDFDVESGALTYLPGVSGPIVTSSSDGTELVFENKEASPARLELWSSGPGGGHVGAITELPEPVEPVGVESPFLGRLDVSDGRVSADGSVLLFRTNSPIPGFNDTGGFAQIYRYEAAGGGLSCVSCPPPGAASVGDARASYAAESEDPMTTSDARVISSDGRRVFFDTPDPLVASDTNGKRDVYEWEAGQVHLISAGTGPHNSYVIGSSASGEDVFFATDDGLLPADTDEGYDVYDARVPRPGDEPAPPPQPCAGDACQGPVPAPGLTPPPASAVFSGSGNLAPAVPVVKRSRRRAPTRAQKLASALRRCAKLPHRTAAQRRARHRCVASAQRRFGTARTRRAARVGRRR
jgi:hypothetical protein